MSSSFDATARINLDIRSFAQGAAAVTKSGGQMEKIFENLNQVLSRVAVVESGLAAKLRTSLQVYNSVSSAAKNYATAVAALQKNEASGANGAKLMAQAFAQLRSSLAQVQGMSEKEYQRLSRTVTLYEKLANVVRSLASAQKQMSSITQNAISAQQKEDAAKTKAEQTARKLALEEQKLALQRDRLAQSAVRTSQEEQRLAIRREQLAQSAARMAQTEERLALGRQRLASSTRSAAQSQVSMSSSSFALRNSIGELEQGFQSLFNTVAKIPTAFAGAAISQEAAFAQVERVVGKADAATVGLLGRFQEIAQQAPISFEEVARIGQLGAAIGISASNLGDFTDTIVKFSLTTGMASEEATILLGRIAQMEDVPISEMEQLGSAILALGTASAATDQEILRVNASIATVSNLFGLTAQQTAGLSSALATLQVRPELSRGALTRVFNELSTAVSDGGTELSKLAKVMGMTDQQVLKLYNNPATRGDFLLAFIEGLSRAAGVGGDVQGVLRALGINAVRDIDVFSRLANNVNVVRDSFDLANKEFAKGTELNRQSKGIYETTSAELQNLSDAFKTLLATMGGPLAKNLGDVASIISEKILTPLGKMKTVLGIFGALATVVTVGGGAWLVYQIGLAKVISSMIAMKELQKNLQVSTLKLKTAFDIFRGNLGPTAEAQAVAANSSRELTVNVQALSLALSRTEIGMRAYAAAAASSAAGLGTLSTATLSAMRSMQGTATASVAMQNTMRQLGITSATTALSMTNVATSNRAIALTQSQVATSSARFVGQTALSAAAVQGLNTSTVRAVPALTTMSASMQRAVTAGAQLGSGLNTAATASSLTAAQAGRLAQATTSVSVGARLASLAFGPWGIALTTIGLLMGGPLIRAITDFRSESDKLAQSAMEQTGGHQAMANAIRADTDAAIAAAGGLEHFNQIVRSGNQDQLASIGVYRAFTVAKSDMAAKDRESAEAAKAQAQETQRAVQTIMGSSSELKKQAQGHGVAAEAARRYLNNIDEEATKVKKLSGALSENTVVIGENSKQWLLDTAQTALEMSKLADGSERSQTSLHLLSETGLDVGKVLKESLENPKKALDELAKASTAVDKILKDNAGVPVDPNTGVDFSGMETMESAKRLKTFLDALRTTIQSQSDATTKEQILQGLLADAMDNTGTAASSASGKIKLTKDALEDLDTDADEAKAAMDEMQQTFTKFGTPLDAFKNAAEGAFKGASDAMNKFSLNSKGGLDAYIKQLEKIAKAQRDWSANLIKISTTLGPDIAEQFRKLGPEAAPAVAQLANLSAKELEKLGPRLREIGSDATSELAASIVQNSGEVKNATLQTRTVIADIFGKMFDKAKTSADFADVSNQYAALVKTLNGLKGVKLDISADDAKAIKSLQDLNLYIDLVTNKKINPKVVIDILKAQGDIGKLQAIIQEAQTSGKLDPKGKAALDTLLFQTQIAQLASTVSGLEAEGKLDAKGKGKLSDEEYRAKVLALTQFLASAEGQGLLNPKGNAQLNDQNYRAQMEGLARLILGEEQAKKFDVNGDGKLSTAEFLALLQALKGAVADANRGKLDAKGHVTLANVGGFKSQLGGIVQAAYSAGSRISQALTRSATVSVGYYYYKKNNPPSGGAGSAPAAVAAATGGWINGPGGPTSDSIPAWLSNGEFVVNASAAKRFGALLEVINRSGGRGFAGLVKGAYGSILTGGNKPIRLAHPGPASTMFGNSALMARTPPQSVAAATAGFAQPQSGPTNIFNINNQYPQAEPTSVTINRSLAYAATISGV